MLDVVHYFLVDEGTNLAAVALSVAWCGASLKLLFCTEDGTTARPSFVQLHGTHPDLAAVFNDIGEPWASGFLAPLRTRERPPLARRPKCVRT